MKLLPDKLWLSLNANRMTIFGQLKFNYKELLEH